MAKPETVKTDRIEDLPDRFLKCRAFGHSMDPDTTTTKGRGRIFEAHIMTRCLSCGVERYDALDWVGVTTSRYYIYPHGYQMSVSISRADAKMEYLARQGVSPHVRAAAKR